jgi:hypothetical protein
LVIVAVGVVLQPTERFQGAVLGHHHSSASVCMAVRLHGLSHWTEGDPPAGRQVQGAKRGAHSEPNADTGLAKCRPAHTTPNPSADPAHQHGYSYGNGDGNGDSDSYGDSASTCKSYSRSGTCGDRDWSVHSPSNAVSTGRSRAVHD